MAWADETGPVSMKAPEVVGVPTVEALCMQNALQVVAMSAVAHLAAAQMVVLTMSPGTPPFLEPDLEQS